MKYLVRALFVVAALLCSAPVWAQSTAATLTTNSNAMTAQAGFLTLPYVQGTYGATVTIDFTKSQFNLLGTQTANATATIIPPYFPTDKLSIESCQNSTGGLLFTWPTNVFDGGAATATDNVFPEQPSKCGTATLNFDGTNLHITSKPSLANNCSGTGSAGTSTLVISNKCCAVTASDIFICTDTTTLTSTCKAVCSGPGTITLTAPGTSDVLWWARLN